jgi:glucosamine kinase
MVEVHGQEFMAIYLGIDSGGTKTRCALGDEMRLLATSMTGGSNVIRQGSAEAKQALQAAVREVCTTAKVDPQHITRIVIGAAGAARPAIAATITSFLAELTPASVTVVGDMVIALESAFGAQPGVIAIAGTGSVAYGRDASGKTARAGGWGFAVSDEGSGHWIGRRAVSAILRARDEDRQTRLTELVLQTWGVASFDDLIQRANLQAAPDFPRLVPVVLRATEEGDQTARSLLAKAGSALAAITSVVLRRLAPKTPYVPVAMSGSVFRQSEDVRRVFYNDLQAGFPGIEVRPDLVEPVGGALALARKPT